MYLQPLAKPICELRLAELRQVVNTLFAEIDAAQGNVLGGRAADPLDDDGRVGLQDDAIVDNFINGQRDEVVVFDNGSLINRLPGLGISKTFPATDTESTDLNRR